MSRSGYSDDCENLNLYRGTVERATRGKRGQRFFRDLVAALDALPAKRLVANELQKTDGEVCALGALGKYKGAPLEAVDTYDTNALGKTFDIAHQLAAETMFVNDDDFEYREETPEQRWERVRKWAIEQIRVTPEELEPTP